MSTIHVDRVTARPDVHHPSAGTPSVVWEAQRGFDDLGRALADLTFTVVDLETTGASAAQGAMITEIGAVKVRGGEVLGEFQTLVDPQTSIPPAISTLTGITDTMVRRAPTIDSVLPAFLEFAAGTVLVAHNAPFDVGFLKHFATLQGRPWPAFEVLDTVKLARRLVLRDEAPNCKLGTLAQLFNATTTPNHRALADARATVDVLHALMERVGDQGVQTLEELRAYTSKVTSAQRRKRHLADGLPQTPGVYLFEDDTGRVLYVGRSTNLRRRVRTYFTASETRSRMGEMVAAASRVRGIECSSELEAQVHEVRLIAHHRPPYNRRSKFPDKVHFLTLTKGPWPRLSLVRTARDDDAVYLGPISSRRLAEACVEALHEAFPLRRCTQRLAASPSGTPCALAEMNLCLSPCDGSVDPESYDALVQEVRATMALDPRPVVEALRSRMEDHAEKERYEDAGHARDRMGHFIRASARSQRLQSLTRCTELVAARRGDDHRWSVHVVRRGRLCASGVIPSGADAHDYVDSLVTSAETLGSVSGPTPAASAEESELILRWLEQPGVRLVSVEGSWTSPVRGAGAFASLNSGLEEARRAAIPFDERRLR